MPELILVALAILAGCSILAWAILRRPSPRCEDQPVIRKFPRPGLRITPDDDHAD